MVFRAFRHVFVLSTILALGQGVWQSSTAIFASMVAASPPAAPTEEAEVGSDSKRDAVANSKWLARYAVPGFDPDSALAAFEQLRRESLAHWWGEYKEGLAVAVESVALEVEVARHAAEGANTNAQQHAEQLAKRQAEADRHAAERIAKAQAEADARAAERITQEQQTINRQVAERIAREQSQADRVAAERIAREQTIADTQAAEVIARRESAANRRAVERIQREQEVANRDAAERIARQQSETDERAAKVIAREQTDANRRATDRIERKQAAANKEAIERILRHGPAPARPSVPFATGGRAAVERALRNIAPILESQRSPPPIN